MARPSNKSFGTWCEENNLTYMIDLWDNKLNKCSPCVEVIRPYIIRM